MKKTVYSLGLTILTVALLSLAMQSPLRSESDVAAPPAPAPPFTGVQFTYSPGGLFFFDSRTGDIWIYDELRGLPLHHYRVRELGGAIERIPLVPLDSTGTPKRGATRP